MINRRAISTWFCAVTAAVVAGALVWVGPAVVAARPATAAAVAETSVFRMNTGGPPVTDSANRHGAPTSASPAAAPNREG